MDLEESRTLVRRAFDAWMAGTAPITDLFAPDMTWHIAGRSAAAGHYNNTRDFIDKVLDPFGRRAVRPSELCSLFDHRGRKGCKVGAFGLPQVDKARLAERGIPCLPST
jgi:ketosteroid isomerase-like protein